MSEMSLHLAPVLPLMAEGAAAADADRSVADEVIAALKANPIMRLSASRELGGLEASISVIGAELEAAAGACVSTAWCLWNHLCTFHVFCGLLGPDNADQLSAIVARKEWVCFPAGAATGISARAEGEGVVLNGVATFGSGARYAEHAGVVFMPEGASAPSFTLIPLATRGVRIDPTWRAMAVRASATDHVYYEGAVVPARRVVDFPLKFRERLREPDFPVINPRYREDWVGISDLWLGAMAAGLARAALEEAAAGLKGRTGIARVKIAELTAVHLNLGQAAADVDAARAAAFAGMAAADARIAAGQTPTEADYLAALSAGMKAVRLAGEALTLIQRVQGGAGLREGAAFERRWRDFQAMPLHINAHPDRVNEQRGRFLLGLATENGF